MKIGMLTVRETDTEQNMRTPVDVTLVWRNCIENASWFQIDREYFYTIVLNSRNKIVCYNQTSCGILDGSLVHPREVFRPAIVAGAASVVVTHNHPSGDVTPSSEDIRITKQLIEAGRIIDIKVIDHVIVSTGRDRKYLSMRESGLCDFK